MSVEITIVCDGDNCGTVIAGGRTAELARRDVGQLGGRTALPGGRDLCPDCARGEA